MRACAVETHVKISQEPLDTEIYRKNAAPQIEPGTQTHILCEPAQSKCMSTCHKKHHKSHFIGKFTGKMPRPRWAQKADTHFVRSCAVETHVKISQEPLDTEIYRKNAAAQSEHPDQAPAFTPTVRTPQCGHTVWGKRSAAF